MAQISESNLLEEEIKLRIEEQSRLKALLQKQRMILLFSIICEDENIEIVQSEDEVEIKATLPQFYILQD